MSVRVISQAYIRIVSTLKKFRMAQPLAQQLHSKESLNETGQKRKNESDVDEEPDVIAKKEKLYSGEQPTTEFIQGKKRKVAMIMGYSGTGYFGIQVNKPYPTIEAEIFTALLKAGAVPQDHVDTPKKMSFQRAARTDKGVSAITNVISLKMRIDIDNIVEKLNSLLPEQIRIFNYIKATKSFDCKVQCTGRTYIYVLPTYSLMPIDTLVKDDCRVTDEILEKTGKILEHFKGTHNFHNYTSGVQPNQAQAKRYMRSFVCGKPFVVGGTEFVILTVNGQSFMQHHIRKMIGITIAIVRGHCGEDVIEKSWGHRKVDIPKAPGLGLLLQSLEFDGYNKKWGSDGEHEKIEWSKQEEEILKFRNEIILPHIYKTESEEKVMMQWLQTLFNHNFDYAQDEEGNFIKTHKDWKILKQRESGEDVHVGDSEVKSDGGQASELEKNVNEKDVKIRTSEEAKEVSIGDEKKNDVI